MKLCESPMLQKTHSSNTRGIKRYNLSFEQARNGKTLNFYTDHLLYFYFYLFALNLHNLIYLMCLSTFSTVWTTLYRLVLLNRLLYCVDRAYGYCWAYAFGLLLNICCWVEALLAAFSSYHTRSSRFQLSLWGINAAWTCCKRVCIWSLLTGYNNCCHCYCSLFTYSPTFRCKIFLNGTEKRSGSPLLFHVPHSPCFLLFFWLLQFHLKQNV